MTNDKRRTTNDKRRMTNDGGPIRHSSLVTRQLSGERLQKILANAGIASRRAAEQMIAAGRVRVNDKVVTEMGVRADPRTDRIEVDGRPISRESGIGNRESGSQLPI